MSAWLRLLVPVGLVWALLGGSAPAAAPNFLIIIADDMGYSDAGCYGSEIATPNLDALAADGVRFTQFYNTARCWPTRGALLTGYYPQQIHRDSMPGVDPRQFGGGGRRPRWAQVVAQRLQSRGYRTYHSGKWHLDGKPTEHGFDLSDEVSRGPGFFESKARRAQASSQADAESFYLTTATAQHAIDCLREHAAEHADRPFFHYLAFHAPHFPLHALPEDIARYQDRYLEGWDNLRTQRHARQLQMGITQAPLSELETEVGPPYAFPEQIALLGPGEVNRPLPWDDLNAVQQRFQATKMAIHAAMIDRMDREIGRVLEQLKAMQAMDNTFICFLSDNGASAEMMVRGDGHDPQAAPGSADTYLCLGPGFSSAANTPFRRHKTWVHEGGIATPFIVHWPQGFSARGELRLTPAHVIDLTPTVLDLAGADGGPVEGGPPLAGQSLKQTLQQDGPAVHETLWFYHEGNRGLRQGDWKIVMGNANRPFPWNSSDEAQGLTGPSAKWELYHLASDRSEQHNLATAEPQRLAAMIATWESMHAQFLRDAQQP